MIYDSILDTIGNTPVVRLNRIAPDGIEMFVKVESFNPLASVKDRLAFAIVNDAEQRGLLKPGDTVVEATSGNTGIALAMVCAAKGYEFVATMADSHRQNYPVAWVRPSGCYPGYCCDYWFSLCPLL